VIKENARKAPYEKSKASVITPYNPLEENAIGTLYNQLSEKERRRYAGAEAM